jgi:proteasome lid subunit RPN8/RPN11
MILRVKKEDAELMVRSSRESYPAEACGILLGKKSGGEKTVGKVILAKNVLGSPTARDHAEEIMRAFELAEKEGREVIGFFHSHPLHEPFWSAEDEGKSKYWAGHSFLIFSLASGSFKCYNKTGEDRVEEERVIIV